MMQGSAYAEPIKANLVKAQSVEERVRQFQSAHDILQTCEDVVVVGGGFVGVELAAEIVGKFGKSKTVTLISSHPTLLERMPEAVGTACQSWLEAKGVKIVFNEKVDAGNMQADVVLTNSGQRFKADVVYNCVGFRAQAEVFREHYSAALDARGGARVNKHLQVEGLRNVFAVGDCMTGMGGTSALHLRLLNSQQNEISFRQIS
jgi:NADH dehydrogenase FAD-containing subunit